MRAGEALRAAAAGAAIGVGGAGLAGMLLGAVEESSPVVDSVDEAQEALVEARQKVEGISGINSQMLEDFGHACVNLVTAYLPGGLLEDVDEDEAVSDLLTDAEGVCGSNRTEVRIAYRSIGQTTQELDKLNDIDLDSYNQNYEDAVKAAEEDSEANWFIRLSLGGAILGLVGGAPIGIIVKNEQRNSDKDK